MSQTSSASSSASSVDPADVDDVDDLEDSTPAEEEEDDVNNKADGSDRQGTGEAGDEDVDLDNPVVLPCLSRQEFPDYQEWSNLVIARISMLELAGAVQAVLLQNKDGTQSGSAHGSLDRTAKKKVLEHWQLIEQPLGYVTHLSGIHSKVGSPCLLHSLRMEFASGQVIEVQGEQDGWKGQAFVAEGLEDNFYVSALVFEKGVCIGYEGYETNVPLHDLMAEESIADPDKLDEILGDSDDEEDNFEGDDDDEMEKDNVIDPKRPPEDDDNPKDLNSWVDTPLPAKTIEFPEKREDMMIANICLCGNNGAIQGVIFHYYNGQRRGELRHARKAADIYDSSIIEKQGGEFVEIEQPDGVITRISGHRLILNNDQAYENYLIHSLKLDFASGQIVELRGSGCYGDEKGEEGQGEAPVQVDPFGASFQKGKYFEYDVPGDFFITELLFGSGRLSGVVGVKTSSIPDASDLVPPPLTDQQSPKKGCFCMPGKKR